MLIGDDKKLLCGILVDFKEELLEAYEKGTEYLYHRSLAWAYQPGGPEILPADMIKYALASTVLESLKINFESFQSMYGIWWKLNVDVDDHIQFPLPKCDKIMPMQHSSWNLILQPAVFPHIPS